VRLALACKRHGKSQSRLHRESVPSVYGRVNRNKLMRNITREYGDTILMRSWRRKVGAPKPKERCAHDPDGDHRSRVSRYTVEEKNL
jgi:hypothetical protein